MKTPPKLVPLKVGDRVRHCSGKDHTGKVTALDPLTVAWTNSTFAGYERAELRKLPAMRCHCPDCDRSKGKKPCPLVKP